MYRWAVRRRFDSPHGALLGALRMKKQIGFWGLLALSVGLNIGGSLFGLTTVAAGLTGPSLPLALLISAVPVILAVLPLSILASAAPTTSAMYRYIQLFSPTLALTGLMTGVTCVMIGALPLMSQIFGLYFIAILPVDPVISGVAVLTVFYVINLVGIRSAVRVQVLLILLLVSALGLYAFLGASQIEASRFGQLFPRGFGGLLAASGLLFTLSVSGLWMVDLGGDVINARRTIPRVLLLGILIAVVINVSILTVTAGAADTMALEGKNLVDVAANFMSAAQLGYFVVAGALLACATTINTVFTLVARWLMVIAAEGLLPRFLSSLDVERGSPFGGLTLAYVLGVLALLSQSSLLFFGTLLNFSSMMVISLVSGLVVTLPKHFPLLYRRSAFHPPPVILWAVCGTVIAANLAIFIFLASTSHKATWTFLGMLLVFGLYATSRRRTLAALPRIAPVEESA
jgi:APA family basic amino acid/polyamine antiporter